MSRVNQYLSGSKALYIIGTNYSTSWGCKESDQALVLPQLPLMVLVPAFSSSVPPQLSGRRNSSSSDPWSPLKGPEIVYQGQKSWPRKCNRALVLPQLPLMVLVATVSSSYTSRLMRRRKLWSSYPWLPRRGRY